MIVPNALRCRPDDLFSIAVYNDLRTVVVGLNSVVTQDGEFDYGRISPEQLISVSESISKLEFPQSEYFRIAAFHHNLLPVPNFRDDGAPERIVRNATLVLHHLIEGGFSLVFHGHTHTSLAYEYRPFLMDADSGPRQAIYVIGTGTLSGSERDSSQHYFHLTTVRCQSRGNGSMGGAVIQPYRLWESGVHWRHGQKVRIKFSPRLDRKRDRDAGIVTTETSRE